MWHKYVCVSYTSQANPFISFHSLSLTRTNRQSTPPLYSFSAQSLPRSLLPLLRRVSVNCRRSQPLSPPPSQSCKGVHLHLMYPLLQQHHVYLMFGDTCCITNQKQRYAGVTVTLLRRNSEREIKLARDRVIDFGKYKGKMLGSLPSSYLKWVSKNLRARDFEEWANLADEVLLDPIYKDRIEWEFALNVLNGNKISSAAARSIGAADSELQEISERFGWDNLDKVGWSKVDFDLLGTSKGGRIPRLLILSDNDTNTNNTKPNHPPATSIIGSNDRKSSSGSSSSINGRTKRMERRARQKMRLRTTNEAQQQKDDIVTDIEEFEDDNINIAIANPFPGRQSFLSKAINHRTILN